MTTAIAHPVIRGPAGIWSTADLWGKVITYKG